MKQLKLSYLFILVLTIILVAPPHIFAPPTLMYARFPHYLEKMQPFLGLSWPITFEIYHWALVVLVSIFSINMLGITFKLWKSIAKISSLIGLFVTIPMVLFFFFIFINVNAPNAIIYGLYSVVLLIVDFLTFKALITRRKEA